ncbi:MAG: CPBP family intramembrane metalloprotease [Oscillospiraceae bacterium]|nr:CPBP family intramembrane metalloprotease [Oscillospiraceae bacterium]
MKLSISMSRKEVIFGWLLMAGQLLILPVVAVMLNDMLPAPLSDTQLNIALFALEFLLATVIFRKFLISSARLALRTPFRCLRFAALGLLLYYIGSFLVGLVIGSVDSDFSNINDSNISVLAQDNYTLIFLCTVLLVPVTEELLYRGLIFRGLQKKNRLIAYLVSAAVFSLIHVVGYIGMTSTTTLLLCFLQYLPAGLSLAWAYEKADTIWAPILMHMTVNQISISLMR